MNIDIKFIKKNKKFILFSIVFMVFLIVISLLIPNDVNSIPKKELEDMGSEKINKLIINEIMSSNSGAVASLDGGVYDWIELYNGHNYDINLKNYSLSDQENKGRWAFPEVTIKANTYLVVYLSGKNQEGLYANFKINRSEESIFLKNTNGKVIDAANISNMNKNEVMARDLNGNWFLSTKVTPGFINTIEGYNNYLNSLIEESDIKINEVLPKNVGNFKNSYNNYVGYIEIINTGKNTVNLENYCISDSLSNPFRMCLQEMFIKPNSTVIIYMGDYENNKTEYYSGFNLNSKNGDVVLTNNKGKIIDKVSYNNLASGLALIKENGSFYESSNISPGYLNNQEGRNDFAKNKLKNNEGLIINEVMNNNNSFLPQNGNEFYDWIELKNNSNKDINLNEYTLTTNDNTLDMYRLPDKVLSPGEFYIIMASGDNNLTNSSYNHAGFKISEIESLYLVKDKEIIDSLFVADVPLGYSFGRGLEYGLYYYNNPTPNVSNRFGVDSVAYTPSFSVSPGIYNNSDGINLEIEGNGTIYYTLDGSTPTTSSKVYDGPIFLNKTTVVKAVSYQADKLISAANTGSYIINENHTLPVMSVSLNPSSFNLVQGNAWNTELEVSSYAELYEDGKSFSIPCGFKLFGGSTRGLSKKSFALKFKSKYGASSLNYQVFENRDYSKYDTLVLRSGSQDNEAAFIRDILATSLVDGVTNLKVQAYKSVILYINGNYWGVYNIREKVDEDFIGNNYNVDGEKSNIVRIDYQLNSGTSDDYRYVVNYLNTHDMSNPSNYEYIKTKLNISSFLDYWAAENWVSNNDIINTRFYSHPDVDSGRVNMVFYDLDYGMYHKKKDYFSFSVQKEGMSDFHVSTEMMRSLIKSKEFQHDFLNRISYQLENVWNEKRVLARIDEIYNSLKPEMERNQIRWGMTMEYWEDEVEYLRDYAKERGKYVKSTAKRFFGLTDEQMKEYFGD